MQRFCLRGQTWSVPLVVACVWIGAQQRVQAQPQAVEKNVIPFTEVADRQHQITADLVQAGDSSRRTRAEGIAQLPLAQLDPAHHRSVQVILDNLSLFRRLPTVSFAADRRTYDYFLQHPDVAVSIWRAMEISQVQLTQSGPVTYQTDTRDGTVGTVEVLLRTPESVLILCHGQLQGPGMPRPIQARALMHLQPKTVSATHIQHHCDLFVSFPSQTVEALAKVVSPMSFRIADKNFEEISLFVSLMSNAMRRQPGWMEQISVRLEGVPPERGHELRTVTANVYVDAERQRLKESGQPVTLEAMMPPVATNPVTPTSGTLQR